MRPPNAPPTVLDAVPPPVTPEPTPTPEPHPEAAPGAGRGMEHANSTAIALRSTEQLPNLAAHEFFHLWNVKRIRPATLDS